MKLRSKFNIRFFVSLSIFFFLTEVKRETDLNFINERKSLQIDHYFIFSPRSSTLIDNFWLRTINALSDKWEKKKTNQSRWYDLYWQYSTYLFIIRCLFIIFIDGDMLFFGLIDIQTMFIIIVDFTIGFNLEWSWNWKSEFRWWRRSMMMISRRTNGSKKDIRDNLLRRILMRIEMIMEIIGRKGLISTCITEKNIFLIMFEFHMIFKFIDIGRGKIT